MSAIQTPTATAKLLNDGPHFCGTCGTSLAGRWESLSKGLAITLVSFAQTVSATGVNDVHVLKDMHLTVAGATNFQKLRYFGLVAKVEDKPGHWLLTRRGEAFVRNEIRVNKRVYVFRNAIQDRSTETVSVEEAIGQPVLWPRRESYITPPESDQWRQTNLF